MKSSDVLALVRAHFARNELLFEAAVRAIAAGASKEASEQLLRLLTRHGPHQGEFIQLDAKVAPYLHGRACAERLRDVVLDDAQRADFERFLLEARSVDRLALFGLKPRNKLMLNGPPGCGKTMTASALAGELGLPLLTVQFGSLFGSHMGESSARLSSIFDEMGKRRAVFLFDEFDAVAQARGDSRGTGGEMNRIVVTLLQRLDAAPSDSIIIAATNHSELLDRAVFRRFDMVVNYDRPNELRRSEFIERRLSRVGVAPSLAGMLTQRSAGWSFADIGRACDDAIREVALSGRQKVTEVDVLAGVGRVERGALSGKEGP